MADRAILKLRHPEPEVRAAQAATKETQVQHPATPDFPASCGATAVTKRFDGCWLIYRKVPRGFARPKTGRHMPRFRHDTFESAEAEAMRLLGLHPESTFVLLQERAVVRNRQ